MSVAIGHQSVEHQETSEVAKRVKLSNARPVWHVDPLQSIVNRLHRVAGSCPVHAINGTVEREWNVGAGIQPKAARVCLPLDVRSYVSRECSGATAAYAQLDHGAGDSKQMRELGADLLGPIPTLHMSVGVQSDGLEQPAVLGGVRYSWRRKPHFLARTQLFLHYNRPRGDVDDRVGHAARLSADRARTARSRRSFSGQRTQRAPCRAPSARDLGPADRLQPL